MATYAVTYQIKGHKSKNDRIIKVEANSNKEALEEAKSWVGNDCVPKRAIRM